jgi:hypothetical protein
MKTKGIAAPSTLHDNASVVVPINGDDEGQPKPVFVPKEVNTFYVDSHYSV